MTFHGDLVFSTIGDMISVPGLKSDGDLAALAERGLSVSKFERLKSVVPLKDAEVHPLVLPRRTLTHRKRRRQPLTKDESDRALRVAYIVALAEAVFGDRARAMHWMRRPSRGFAGRPPIATIATEAGAREVEQRLHAIDHGIHL